MAKIIPLASYKEQTAIRAVSRYWGSMFDEPLDSRTRLSDLQPRTLSYLAEPGDDRTAVLYALILGISGFSETTTFESLDSKTQSRILDTHLFLSDQIRFEIMYRLGWIEEFVGNRYPLFDTVFAFDRIKQICQNQPPSLTKHHEAYNKFVDLFERDQQVFIRRMVSSAIEAFKQTHRLT